MVEDNQEVKEEIRELLGELLEEYDLETVFWSLDEVYDEYNQRVYESLK